MAERTERKDRAKRALQTRAHLPDHGAHCHSNTCHSPKAWWRHPLAIVCAITIVALLLSWAIPFLNPLLEAFLDYLALIWWAILLGFLLGGIIDHFVPDEWVATLLAQRRRRTILYATALGFLLSACSHGILALAVQLYKKGAGVPAVVAFLLASPWANLPMTIVLFGFFGWKALVLILSAILIAIITGFIFQLLDRLGMIERAKPIAIDEGFSIRRDARKRWLSYRFDLGREAKGVARGAWSLTTMVLWWILIGMLFASAARAFIPTGLFEAYLGASLLGLALTLIFATIIEVCSEGSSPLAFEIYRQTGAFGNAFTFLMAGVATDYTEIGLLWSNIGKRTAIWLPIVTVPQILLLAWIFNLLF